jgi:hypothetical protein
VRRPAPAGGALTPAAKRSLQDVGRLIRPGRRVAPGAVLLRLLELEAPDPAAELFEALRVDRALARQRLASPPAAA